MLARSSMRRLDRCSWRYARSAARPQFSGPVWVRMPYRRGPGLVRQRRWPALRCRRCASQGGAGHRCDPQPVELGAAGSTGDLDRVEHRLGPHVRRDPPAHDRPAEAADDEVDVGDPGERRHEGSGVHPLVWWCGGDVTLAQVQVQVPSRGESGLVVRTRLVRLDLYNCLGAHQPGDQVSADVVADSAAASQVFRTPSTPSRCLLQRPERCRGTRLLGTCRLPRRRGWRR